MPTYDHRRVYEILRQGGLMARRAPPAWDGDRISQPIFSPQGGYLGRVLPGRGLYLSCDPFALGLTRLPPHVFARSHVDRMVEGLERALDFLGLDQLQAVQASKFGRLLDPERLAIRLVDHGVFSPTVRAAQRIAAAITTYDGIITARAGGNANDIVASKTTVTTAAQQFSSIFRAGGLPLAGTYTNIPGGAVHTRASTGAWNGLKDPGGSNKKYLLTFGYGSSSVIDWGILVDLLVCAGNINANATGNQTINSTAQTRQYGSTLGAGVMMTFDVTTALGATASNLTVNSYTDQDGNTAQTTAAEAMTTSAITFRLQPVTIGTFMPLASGDFGVRSVETLAFSAAMLAGVVALNLYFPLAFLPGVAGNLYVERDSTTQIDGITELVNASQVTGCLTMYLQTNSTTTGTVKMFARTTEG